MALGIESVFALHDQVLQVQSRRMELIASNLANTDTPNYKARDIDFRQVLSRATNTSESEMITTDGMHINTTDTQKSVDTAYRTPMQPSLDGNTVDANVEKTALAEASMRYESTLTFLSRKIEGLRAAMRIG